MAAVGPGDTVVRIDVENQGGGKQGVVGDGKADVAIETTGELTGAEGGGVLADTEGEHSFDLANDAVHGEGGGNAVTGNVQQDEGKGLAGGRGLGINEKQVTTELSEGLVDVMQVNGAFEDGLGKAGLMHPAGTFHFTGEGAVETAFAGETELLME